MATPIIATNLIAGPAKLWVAPFGSTEPLDSALADDPAAPWRFAGATNDGVTLNIAREFFELEVDQVTMTVESRQTKFSYTVATNLAEGTLENLALALNELDSSITTTAGVDSLEPTVDDSGATVNYAAILLDGRAPNGARRRVICRKTLSTEDVESAYKKDAMTLIPVSFKGHWVSDSIKPIRIMNPTPA